MLYQHSRAARIWNKHSGEVSALALGKFPDFVTSLTTSKPLSEIPIFVFHEVNPENFESQLTYLTENNYRSLNCGELEKIDTDSKINGNEIVLTFDDATSTFWTYAYPLLKKYNHHAIVFAIAGLIPEDNTIWPNLNDLWLGKASSKQLEKRARQQPLCTWKELEIMSSSENIDIQCHSLTHSRIFTSSKLVDFIHPKFYKSFYGNVGIPISTHDNPKKPERSVEYGYPIFKNNSRMRCDLRFYESKNLVKYMQDYIYNTGGINFFSQKKWYSKLKNRFEKWSKSDLGRYESETEMINSVRYEFKESKKLLEERLNTSITHFCYPWFESSLISDEIANEEGFKNLYYSFDIPYSKDNHKNKFTRHTRITEEYLYRLPGRDRKSLLTIQLDRAKNAIGR